MIYFFRLIDMVFCNFIFPIITLYLTMKLPRHALYIVDLAVNIIIGTSDDLFFLNIKHVRFSFFYFDNLRPIIHRGHEEYL